MKLRHPALLLALTVMTLMTVSTSQLCSVASATTVARATTTVPSNLAKHVLEHDGLKRTYFVHVPNGLSDHEKLPVVFALHGGGRGDGRTLSEHLDFRALADEYRFVVVYPNGVDNQWNDGRGRSFRKTASNVHVDDVGFMSRLIDEVVRKYHADERRVYVTGVSNGGMMASRLGCELTAKIAAIAPVISNLPKKVASTVTPAAPIPVLVINGTHDPLVPWEGGHVTVFGKTYGEVLSTEQTIDFWVKHNGLSGSTSTEQLPDITPNDKSTVHVTRFGNADSTAPVLLYEIRGGGHTLPGVTVPARASRLLGNANEDISTPEVVWNFLRQFKRLESLGER